MHNYPCGDYGAVVSCSLTHSLFVLPHLTSLMAPNVQPVLLLSNVPPDVLHYPLLTSVSASPSPYTNSFSVSYCHSILVSIHKHTMFYNVLINVIRTNLSVFLREECKYWDCCGALEDIPFYYVDIDISSLIIAFSRNSFPIQSEGKLHIQYIMYECT